VHQAVLDMTQARKLLDAAGDGNVLVIGDAMLD